MQGVCAPGAITVCRSYSAALTKASVCGAGSRTWFEFFWIPLVCLGVNDIAGSNGRSPLPRRTSGSVPSAVSWVTMPSFRFFVPLLSLDRIILW